MGKEGTVSAGIHHVTLITRKVQDNVDFYVGFLGLRLVKRTAGFEDATQLHLFYGDAVASPGSLITFLVWEDGSPGRVGHGAPAEISLAISPEAIGFWLTRALQFGVAVSGPAQEFGEPVLRLTDPDGIIVKLVGTDAIENASPWVVPGISEDDAIRRIRGATIWSEKPEETVGFLEKYIGLSSGPEEGSLQRMVSQSGDIIDVRDASGFWTAAPGTGTFDHIAFRAHDRDAIEALHGELDKADLGATTVHDRTYFYSLYVREPSGTLIEVATDSPGFTLDEPLEGLGETLFIPAHFLKDKVDLDVVLPQFGLPGEPRTVYRDLPFVHRIHVPEEPDGSTLIVLHGTGGSETSLMPLGRRLMPNATLIGVRGRSTEEGVARFFRRFGMNSFDQKDIRSEAEAFAAFVEELPVAYGVDPSRLTFLGYSNGANMLGAVMQLQPRTVRRAVLLRAVKVLEDSQPPAELPNISALLLTGKLDLYGPYAKSLQEQLSSTGVVLEERRLDAGHDLVDADELAIREWLSA
jgi:phospholipase/carboxylesterase